MNGEDKRILLLVCERFRGIGTVKNHIDAFVEYSKYELFIADSSALKYCSIDLHQFDAVVIHYSVVISIDSYLPASVARILTGFTGPKILFIQDEYRWVNKTADAIQRLGIDFVFTVVNEDAVRQIYHHPGLRDVVFETTLTGFVPEELTKRAVPDYGKRPIDVSYRARKLPVWCGSFGQEKWQIGERFGKDAKVHALNCDIDNAEGNRIYGDAWIDFVANSKAVLGTESGSGFIDFDGEVTKQIDNYSEQHPDASFEELKDRFLGKKDGEILISVISPRCFEAAALRTLMILYPGDYSGILRPNEHYVPLLRDNSNMDEVVAILQDDQAAGEIIARAYQDIACSGQWTFGAFIQRFDEVVDGLLVSCAEQRKSSIVRASPAELHTLSKKWQKQMRWAVRYEGVKFRLAQFLKKTEDYLRDRRAGNGNILSMWVAGAVLSGLSMIKPIARRVLLGRKA